MEKLRDHMALGWPKNIICGQDRGRRHNQQIEWEIRKESTLTMMRSKVLE